MRVPAANLKVEIVPTILCNHGFSLAGRRLCGRQRTAEHDRSPYACNSSEYIQETLLHNLLLNFMRSTFRELDEVEQFALENL